MGTNRRAAVVVPFYRAMLTPDEELSLRQPRPLPPGHVRQLTMPKSLQASLDGSRAERFAEDWFCRSRRRRTCEFRIAPNQDGMRCTFDQSPAEYYEAIGRRLPAPGLAAATAQLAIERELRRRDVPGPEDA